MERNWTPPPNLKKMLSAVAFLKKPELVAQIQEYFGVKVLKGQDGHGKDKGYVVTNKVWYYVFVLGTALGDEIFYSCFIPFWFWNVDGFVGRRFVLVWTIVMYIGTFGLKLELCSFEKATTFIRYLSFSPTMKHIFFLRSRHQRYFKMGAPWASGSETAEQMGDGIRHAFNARDGRSFHSIFNSLIHNG